MLFAVVERGIVLKIEVEKKSGMNNWGVAGEVSSHCHVCGYAPGLLRISAHNQRIELEPAK